MVNKVSVKMHTHLKRKIINKNQHQSLLILSSLPFSFHEPNGYKNEETL